jgi:hypothetical protein
MAEITPDSHHVAVNQLSNQSNMYKAKSTKNNILKILNEE